MAIRLIDQYPNRAGVPNADYPHGVPRNKSTPTSTDGTPFEQAWFRDQEGFFQGLLETAGITPSGSPDTVEQSDYLDALVSAMHGVVEVDVGGVGDVTLGIYPSRVFALRLTGTLGADVDLIVPDTERLYTIIDETSGSFSVTVRTSAGTGVVVAEELMVLRSDGTNVVYAQAGEGVGQNIAVFDTAGVTNWTVPDVLRLGLRKAHVTVVGGGGGGGGAASAAHTAGGGGQAGGLSIGVHDLSGISSVAVTVGDGGDGGSAGIPGASGGSSSFGAIASAPGGAGGDFGVGANPAAVRGGTSSNIGVGGQIVSAGEAGGNALSLGSTPFHRFAGNGGSSLFGGGGRGGVSNTSTEPDSGNSGAGPGAGGGGGVSAGNGNPGVGGNGADGIIIVRW